MTRNTYTTKEAKMTEWISVDNRLPPYNEVILVWYGDIALGYRTRTDIDGEHWDSDDVTLGKVTHWMPLPKRPTELGTVKIDSGPAITSGG